MTREAQRRKLWADAYLVHATAEPSLHKAAANKADEAVQRFDRFFPEPTPPPNTTR